MEWIVLLLIGWGLWHWLGSASKKKPAKARTRPTSEQRQTVADEPEPAIKVSVTASLRRSSNDDVVDVGNLTPAGERSWVLNPKSPLPLTVANADQPIAEALKALLSKPEYWANKVPEIALLVAKYNLRFLEIEAFATQYKLRFDEDIAKQIAQSREWPDASDKDKEDLRAEFEEKALESIDISLGRIDVKCLLEGQPPSFTEDDALLNQFGEDLNLYSFYLSLLGRRGQVSMVKADDYYRKSWDKLAEKGFAKRGKDIPMADLLEGLRLKDINEILEGAIEKPLGRKAKAIEAALALPDVSSRVSARISFREMFQVIPPMGLDVDQLQRSFAYANAVATVAQQTYYTAVRTLEALDERKRDPEFYNAWEITHFTEPMPACAVAVCKRYDRLPAKRPPFHVGCSCNLECTFKDA